MEFTRRDAFRAAAALASVGIFGPRAGGSQAAAEQTQTAERGLPMTSLFGRDWSADELYSYVGQMAQVAGIQRFELTEGKARGVRCARVYTGSGFEFLVVPDRAMDIALASFNGAPLNYLGQAGIVAPEYHEPIGKGWDRTFFGGLNQTCGLRSAGHASELKGEEFGLHGRISTSPAEDICVTQGWRGDEYVLEMKGLVREAHSYKENVVMTRTITTKAGAKSFTQRDEVVNEGARSTCHTIMYHVNPGFPVLTEKSKVLWSIDKMEGGDSEAEFTSFVKPGPGIEGGGYVYHKADAKGIARAGVINPDMNGGEGFGMYIAYPLAQLPVMVTWRHLYKHAYLIGIEPANCRINTNKKLDEQGILPMLEPGERRVYEIEFGVLAGRADIDGFKRALP
jgi:hypothetical protein